MDDKLKIGFAVLAIVGVFVIQAYRTEIEPEEEKPTTEVYFADVKPIFQNRCKTCHSQAHWDWTKYDVAFKNRDKIRTRVWVTRTMPQGGLITEKERVTIRDWVDQGGRE